MNTEGYFILSLDFELFWGVFDVRSLSSYKKNLVNVKQVIPRLLKLSDTYGIHLNFATVGFLFAKTKAELLEACPSLIPTYKDNNFNPYKLIQSLGNSEEDDPYHYANSLIKLIRDNGNHEIASHTFSHFYCNEEGQTLEQFEEDIIAAKKIANQYGIDIKSIVFPRNQMHHDYLKICTKHGFSSYRGIEKHWMYDTHDTHKLENPLNKIFRLLDTYVNISGYNTTPVQSLQKDNGILNIPSSRFLRPHNKILSILEPLKVSRIKKGMTHAAKRNEIYHLWWHPHNFGDHMEANFYELEQLFIHYSELHTSYNFKNDTMTGLVNTMNQKKSI